MTDNSKFLEHEVRDRAYVLCETMSFLCEHPTVEGNKELAALAETAHQALFDIWQNVGEILEKEAAKQES